MLANCHEMEESDEEIQARSIGQEAAQVSSPLVASSLDKEEEEIRRRVSSHCPQMAESGARSREEEAEKAAEKVSAKEKGRLVPKAVEKVSAGQGIQKGKVGKEAEKVSAQTNSPTRTRGKTMKGKNYNAKEKNARDAKTK